MFCMFILINFQVYGVNITFKSADSSPNDITISYIENGTNFIHTNINNTISTILGSKILYFDSNGGIIDANGNGTFYAPNFDATIVISNCKLSGNAYRNNQCTFNQYPKQ